MRTIKYIILGFLLVSCNKTEINNNDNNNNNKDSTIAFVIDSAYISSLGQCSDTITNIELIDGFVEIELECINGASSGDIIKKRIDTKEQYDSFYYYRFTKPLFDWFNNNYNSLIDGVKSNYPNARIEQYDSILINDYIYNFYPFMGIKDCEQPCIDFNKYTLLGQTITVGGCSYPKVDIEVNIETDKNELIFLLKVETYGSCEMAFDIKKWILVDKLDNDIKVNFKSEENNIE